jgi:uncharacterized membrane-anchored protein
VSIRKAIVIAFIGVVSAASAMAGDEAGKERNPFTELAWQRGPMSFALGTRSKIDLPAETAALSESESSKFLKLTGNLPSTGVNIVTHGAWWATFEFDDAGYVKDDEKIDPDALLQQMKDSDGPSNEERKKAGYPALITDGWYVPPHYDAGSKRLEWALKIHSVDDNRPVINYTVRILGRSGYERVVLVSSPDKLDRDVAEFKKLLTGFDFNSGEKYSEFKQGDRVAQFGLAALVAGGAAAVATKTGFWKVLLGALAAGWKFVAAGAVAVVAGISKMFKRRS